MNNNRLAVHLCSWALLVLPLLATAGEAEVEPNDPADSAQMLKIDKGLGDVNGVIGHLGDSTAADLDYFRFYGQAGDVVTIDVDGAWGGAQSFDSILAVFGPGDLKMLRLNDDNSLDEGSSASLDSRIDNFVLPSTGIYTIGVSSYPRYFRDGGSAYDGTTAAGDYSVVVTGVSDLVKHVSIEVKPGNTETVPLNPRSRGKTPVAILSSTEFNALSVDPQSLSFGATGEERSLAGCNPRGKDVNGDGRLDLLCHFRTEDANFEVGDLEGILTGKMRDGTMIEGRGPLKVTPQKKLSN